MLAKITEKNTKKGVEIDGHFYSFQGENQSRIYINFNGQTISLHSNVKDFEVGEVVELDNYRSTRANKSTAAHGARLAKNRYSIEDYLSTEQQGLYKKTKAEIEQKKAELNCLVVKYKKLVEAACSQREQELARLKEQKLQEQKAKQESAKAKKLALFQKLAKELGVSIA